MIGGVADGAEVGGGIGGEGGEGEGEGVGGEEVGDYGGGDGVGHCCWSWNPAGVGQVGLGLGFLCWVVGDECGRGIQSGLPTQIAAWLMRGSSEELPLRWLDCPTSMCV